MSNVPRRHVVQQAKDEFRAAVGGAVTLTDPDTLGCTGLWDIVQGSWKEYAPVVVSTFRQHGIDPMAILPPEPDWTTAFGRAVQSVRAKHSKNFSFLDAAKGPNGERRTGILKVERNGHVTTSHDGTITCPTDGSAPYVEVPDPYGIAQEILDLTRDLRGKYTSDDIRASVVAAFKLCAAMPLRSTQPHVVYWIPPAGTDMLAKLSDAVESLGWGRIELFAIRKSDPRAMRGCVTAVNQGLESRLKEFSEQVEKYATTDPKKTRPTTIENMIDEAKRIKSQGVLYREILGAAVSSVDDKIRDVEDTLRKTLGLVESAHGKGA